MEYIELLLCRDIFHCVPSQLDNEDAERVYNILACAAIQEKAKKPGRI